MTARLPQPPVSVDPQDIHRSLTDVVTFLRRFYEQGSKQIGFTQLQIDTFTDLSYLGTVLFNTTTNESNVSFLDGSVVNWRAI
jgi:prepilin-type processing-associated H-X9-DG protein